MADPSAKFFDGIDGFFPPKREDALAETARNLAETTANLDAYIECRAQEIARPYVAAAEREAEEAKRQLADERQRREDLIVEFRRQISALERRAERAEKKEPTDD